MNWDSLHARLTSQYRAWRSKKWSTKRSTDEICLESTYRQKVSANSRYKAISIIGLRKALYGQVIPESSYMSKEIVDIDILITSRNGDTEIIQPIRITSWPLSRIKKWKQLSQLRWKSNKVIPTEKTYAGSILAMSQMFKRGIKRGTNSSKYLFL